MLIFGFLLILLAALAIVGAIFLIDGANIEYFGIDMPPVALFVIGALSAVFIVMGLKLIRVGTARSLRTRKEHKRLQELNHKLDSVEAENGNDREGR